MQHALQLNSDIFCVGVMYSGEYDACDVTLSVYPHRASLKNMPMTSHRGQAYFSSLPSVDIHSRVTSQASIEFCCDTIELRANSQGVDALQHFHCNKHCTK
jgi:hypothetical protein